MTKERSEAKAVLAAVRDGLPAIPLEPTWTEEQRQLKARFWLLFKQNPMTDRDDVTPALVEQVTGKSVHRWLADPKFWAWFTTKDSVKQGLEVAAEKAAELAILYLDPTIPFNDNARVQLIKYVLEFSGRSPPSRKEIKWHDKEIADLTPEQLDALIVKLSSQPKKELP
jgi:hypothetical protein